MPIPTDIAWTNCAYFPMPLNDHFQVFTAIDTVKQVMEAHGWSKIGKLFARTTMQYGGVVGSGGAFSTIILDFFGKGLKIFNSLLGERDPTGDDTGVNGATFIGVDMAGLTSDSARDAKFVAAMNDLCSPFFLVTLPEDGGNAILTITEIMHDDIQRNDFFWTANVLSGYEFNGPTKYGGWMLLSSFANGISTGTAEFYSSPGNNFVVTITLDLPPRSVRLPPFYFASRLDAWMVINPYMWIFGNLGYPYVPAGVDEVVQGGSDWWFCVPRVVPTRLLDLVPGLPNPIEYCGFVSYNYSRAHLVDKGATIYMNGYFDHTGRLEDCGVCLVPLNSMYHSDGALTTQTQVPIEISSILGITENQAIKEIRIVGDVWDMYLVSKYYPQNAHFTRPTDDRGVFVYRSQQFPCEVSLLCAYNFLGLSGND